MRTEFLGKKCPVCRGIFQENDNVVVCPICGTPHHRSCYAEENKCGLESLHSDGFVWNGYLPDEERTPQTRDNDENSDSIFDDLNEAEMSDPIILNFLNSISDSKTGEDGVSMKELTTFASRSLYHYEYAFRVIRGGNGRKKRKAFFNICSGLLAPTFQFYRKMDVLGMIVIAVMLLPALLIALNESYFTDNSSMYYFFNILSVAEQVLLCAFGDYLYYHHAIKQIIRIRERFKENTDSAEYYAALEAAGRPSLLRAVVGTLIFALGASLILLIPRVQ